MRAAVAMIAALALAAPAAARTPEEAQQAELLALRREVAGQVQLSAADLLDELVYRWTQAPPFAEATPVVLADLSVPVGLGTGLAGLLEDHLAELLLANPASRVTLTACPACTATVVRSGPEGTVVARGFDDPAALDKLGVPGGRHALYIDFAAEGAALVLRARITRLTPELPIVYSHTLSSAVGAPSLLRHPQRLKSAAEARDEYLDALEDRGPFTIPVRFAVRTYAAADETGVPPAPLIWLQTGFEAAMTQTRSWTASIVLGYAWLPEAYDGFMVQSRMSRLISGETRSLTGPDVYLFLGGALMTVDGQAVALLSDAGGQGRGTFAGLHLGLEMRVGNRIGASVFLENMPAFNDSERIGSFVDLGLDFHSFGAEVSFCF
ncbi:MAG: hypothetical protein R3F65_19290 [bacterium]